MTNYNYWFDNFGIFYANLTWFHVLGMFLSWIAFALSFWSKFSPNKKQKIMLEESNDINSEYSTEDVSLQTQYKLARQKLAEQNLTPEQRSKEKEAEAQQLAAILKLLQEKSETFQLSSMDQLEDQLKLYRK